MNKTYMQEAIQLAQQGMNANQGGPFGAVVVKDGKIIARKSKKGKKFFGCSTYPECTFVSWFEPVEQKCPNCNSYMVKKYNKQKGNFLECANAECKHKIEIQSTATNENEE